MAPALPADITYVDARETDLHALVDTLRREHVELSRLKANQCAAEAALRETSEAVSASFGRVYQAEQALLDFAKQLTLSGVDMALGPDRTVIQTR